MNEPEAFRDHPRPALPGQRECMRICKALVVLSILLSGTGWTIPVAGQVLRHEYLQYDFDTTGFGYDDPGLLGRAFFAELQGSRNLQKFFGTQQVFSYMISLADMRQEKMALEATSFYWNEFETQRDQYCRQLLDNLDSRNMDMNEAKLDSVIYKIERVNDSSTMAADIQLQFSYNKDTYSILLDDCGQVKGKWFLMTPFVLWQGKVNPKPGE